MAYRDSLCESTREFKTIFWEKIEHVRNEVPEHDQKLKLLTKPLKLGIKPNGHLKRCGKVSPAAWGYDGADLP